MQIYALKRIHQKKDARQRFRFAWASLFGTAKMGHMKDAEPGKTNQPGRTKRSWRIVLPLGAAIAAILIGIAICRQTQKPQVLAQVDLADGRIIQVEAVTYGWKHKIGNESLLLKSFGPWLPQSVRELLEPKVLQSKWDLE